MVSVVGDTDLELSTMDVLRGASDLRNRLLIEISTGTPSISDLAYAVKLRVKEDYKIIDKVKSKRLEKSSYDVSSLRDIIGLRIVSLYRLDALKIIPLVIELIDNSSDTGPFKRGSLEEIRVYSTNPSGYAQGLSHKLDRLFKDHGYRDIALFVETPSNYTSIHMVAWGYGKYQDNYRRIPVEIQIRTAFEDAWGEIEHSLKYKRKKNLSITDPHSTERVNSSLAHLNVLKTMVDGIAQYADQIKIQLRAIDEERTRSSYTRAAEEPQKRLAPLRDLPAGVREAVQLAVSEAKPALEGGPLSSSKEKIKTLERCLTILSDCKKLLSEVEVSEKTCREANYVIDMQTALFLFEIGNAQENGEKKLRESASIYSDIESRLPNRLVVLYRLAKVLDVLGDHEGALARLRKVVSRLGEKREPTPAKHWIRAAAPRVLGVILWEDARRARDAASTAGGREELDLLMEAFEVTKQAFNQKVWDDPATSDQPSEKIKAANNLLYYALEIADAKHAVGESFRLPSEEVLNYLSDMDASDPSAILDPRTLDTARRAYSYLHDHSRALICAQRLIAMVENLSISEWPDTPANRESVAAARALIATVS